MMFHREATLLHRAAGLQQKYRKREQRVCDDNGWRFNHFKGNNKRFDSDHEKTGDFSIGVNEPEKRLVGKDIIS